MKTSKKARTGEGPAVEYMLGTMLDAPGTVDAGKVRAAYESALRGLLIRNYGLTSSRFDGWEPDALLTVAENFTAWLVWKAKKKAVAKNELTADKSKGQASSPA